MKKIIIFVLSVFLIVSSLPVMAVNSPESVQDEKNCAELLLALGIYQKSDFSGDSEFVSRGDAAKLVVKMLGAPTSPELTLPFSDVDISDANHSYIATAYSMGLISGTSQATFSPDEPILMPQIAKIIMSGLGYDDLCVASGGYPSGYMTYANKLDLFEGVELSDGKITYAQMSVIILNALKAELMLPVSFGDEIRYESYESRNLLSEVFDIYFEIQIVEADKYMSLYEKSGTGEDEIIADSVIYNASAIQGFAPVGQTCTLYYTKNSGSSRRVLLYADSDMEENKVYSFAYEDIENASDDRVEYTLEGKTKSLYISDDAVFLFNGQLADSKSRIFERFDELELIDNNGDIRADVVHIKKYKTIQVKTLSKDAFAVYDKTNKERYLLENDGKLTTVFYYNGELTDFYEIEKDCILSLMIPADVSSDYTQHVYVSDRFEDAVLKEINSDDGSLVLASGVYLAIADINVNAKAGEKYRVFFDASGRVAALENIENIKSYGYLHGIKEGSFGEISVNVFTMDGEWIEAKLADKITCNDSKIEKEKIYLVSELFSEEELKRQLVEYTINSNGDITTVSTARDVTSKRFTEDEYSLINSDTFRLSFSSESSRFFNSTGNITFGERAYLSENASILVIPPDSDEREKFSITTPDRLTHNIYYKGIRLYNCDEYACSSLAIVSDNTESYKGSNPLVVSGVKKTIDDDGNIVERVYGYNRTTYETQSDVADFVTIESITGSESPLKSGDIIIPVTNSNGKIINFERIHDAGNSPYGASESDVYYDYVTVTGKVVDANSDYVVLDYGTDKASFRLYSTSVYVCEPGKNGVYSVRLGSVNDINIDDDVVMRTYYLRGIVAVVYKK